MKEHVEVINDSFVDYEGKTHYFTIAAISKMLPNVVSELDTEYAEQMSKSSVFYDVETYIEDYGMHDTFCMGIQKALYLGISICNPTDEYNPIVGEKKAIARANNSEPVLLATKPGTINSMMVQALLKQEAKYLKDNPSQFIKGYAEKKAKYEYAQQMQQMKDNFNKKEKLLLDTLEENPTILDKVLKWFKWAHA